MTHKGLVAESIERSQGSASRHSRLAVAEDMSRQVCIGTDAIQTTLIITDRAAIDAPVNGVWRRNSAT